MSKRLTMKVRVSDDPNREQLLKEYAEGNVETVRLHHDLAARQVSLYQKHIQGYYKFQYKTAEKRFGKPHGIAELEWPYRLYLLEFEDFGATHKGILFSDPDGAGLGSAVEFIGKKRPPLEFMNNVVRAMAKIHHENK